MVISILTIITGIIIFNSINAGRRSRDVDRQADLKTLQSAIELYKQRYGRYPARCANDQSWSGQRGTQFACNDGSGQYIVGLAPEFIPTLPVDPRLPDGNAGYVYTVNADRSVYKLAARRTVESEVVTYAHPLKSCDVNNTSQTTGQPMFYNTAPLCNALISTGNKPTQCEENNATFRTSYAVWGGNAPGVGTTVGSSVDNTEDIVCL
jgi:type II secretory pathway pseudopilin PulG